MCKTTISFFLSFLFINLISNVTKRGKLYVHPPNYSIVLVRVNKRFFFFLPHEFFNFLETGMITYHKSNANCRKNKNSKFQVRNIISRTFKDQQIYQKNILVRYQIIAKIARKIDFKTLNRSEGKINQCQLTVLTLP